MIFGIEADANTTKIETEFAVLIGDWLETAYPGWGWMLYVKDGIANIKNVKLSAAIKEQEGHNKPFGFRVFLDKASVSELKKSVLMAGGALLERGHMKAEGYKGQYITKVDMN